jgi:hypothetical protein
MKRNVQNNIVAESQTLFVGLFAAMLLCLFAALPAHAEGMLTRHVRDEVKSAQAALLSQLPATDRHCSTVAKSIGARSINRATL